MVWDYIEKAKLSPMMKHYVEIKEQYPDCLILYRLGDFYEMFFEDAETGARILELTLTSRDCGLPERCPMAGVPHHVIESYSARLVAAGKKVCLVDQMEDPRQAVGLVKRAVTRILTPGTLTDAETLDQHTHNYLMVAYLYHQTLGICYADISTGQIYATQMQSVQEPEHILADWVEMLHPSEIILVDDTENRAFNDAFQKILAPLPVFLSRVERGEMNAKSVREGLANYTAGALPAVFSHAFIAQTALYLFYEVVYAFRDENLTHLRRVQWVEPGKYMQMNAATRENLELTHNLEDGGRKNTLLSILDRTKTAMGSRMMANWLELPLMEERKIQQRLDLVELFATDLLHRLELRERMETIYDIERLLSKLSFRRGNARDLLSFAHSIAPLPEMIRILTEMNHPALSGLLEELDGLEELHDHIVRAIVEEPPLSVNEGGLIREGYSEALDALKKGSTLAQEELLAYEQAQREATGIRNLRVVFRRNQGYFIEITKSNLDRVPDSYHRKQTLKNAERFTSDFLEQVAGRITSSASQIESMEYEIFAQLREEVSQDAWHIQQIADALARLDVLLSLATVAQSRGYVRPTFSSEDRILIREGRHPVVESNAGMDFIANDLDLGGEDNRIEIITGPNMAGKSTYMRQNALILIMAQMGSFVPASFCQVPVTDQIFTRIGARDHLAHGESTFMVEMKEMADILREATTRSFLVLDEVGRGTSTNDGLSIAYAILEHLSDKLPAKTLFATHYHELVELEQMRSNISNRTVRIEKQNGELVFLRKVVPGYADRSYGIEVARLSGMPASVLDRADVLLSRFDAEGATLAFGAAKDSAIRSDDAGASVTREESPQSFREGAVLARLRGLDVNRLTPLEALQVLSELTKEVGEEEGDLR